MSASDVSVVCRKHSFLETRLQKKLKNTDRRSKNFWSLQILQTSDVFKFSCSGFQTYCVQDTSVFESDQISLKNLWCLIIFIYFLKVQCPELLRVSEFRSSPGYDVSSECFCKPQVHARLIFVPNVWNHIHIISSVADVHMERCRGGRWCCSKTRGCRLTPAA